MKRKAIRFLKPSSLNRMYNLPPTQWHELGLGRRVIARVASLLPPNVRLRLFGLPGGVVSVSKAGTAVQVLETQAEEGLYRVPHGWMWSRGAHLDQRNRIVDEVSPGVNRPPAWWMVRRQKFFPTIKSCPGTVFSMIGDDADNLYHWTFDVMPRLRLLHMDRRKNVQVLARLRHPFHRASLEAAGFAPQAILSADPLTFYATDELIAAKIVKGVTADNLANAREIYLKVASSIPPAAAGGRLYVSRAGATSRRVVNESQLLRIIEPLGFRPVAMEKLVLGEQLAAFRDAEIIISPTGAALTHLHLCRPGTRVLILMPAGCEDFLYRDMASTVGLDAQLLYVPLAPGADPDPVKSDIFLSDGCLDAVRAFVA